MDISKELRLEKFDQSIQNPEFKKKLEAFHQSFSSQLKPENGMYGITVIDKGNGIIEKRFKKPDGGIIKLFFDGDKLKRSYEKIDNATVILDYDDQRNPYIQNKYIKNGDCTAKSILSLLPNNTIRKGNVITQTDNIGRITHTKITDAKLCSGPNGFKVPLHLFPTFFERGHLIARFLGGSNTLDNIVAMHKKINHGLFREVERIIEKLIKEGNRVDYEIKVNYKDNTKVPSSFEPKITVNGKTFELSKEHKKIYNVESTDLKHSMQTTVKEQVNHIKPFFNEAAKEGLDSGLLAAGLTFATTTVEQFEALMQDEITAEEMVIEIAKDTGIAGAFGFCTGFLQSAIAQGMNNSNHTLFNRLAEVGVPAAIVSFVVTSFDSILYYAQGEIDGLELAYDLGENASSIIGGAIAGIALGSVVPGVGNVVGAVTGIVSSTIGCALASTLYKSAIAYIGENKDIFKEKLDAYVNQAKNYADNVVEFAKITLPDAVIGIRTSINHYCSENQLPFSV